VSRLPPVDKAAGLPGIIDISKEQVSRGHKVFVICRHRTGERKTEQVEGVESRRVDTPYNFYALREIRRVNKKYPLKIVHTHATACFSLPIYRRLFNGADLKHIVHVHGTTRGIHDSWSRLGSSEKKPVKERLGDTVAARREAFVWRRADAVIAVSDSVKSELMRLYGVNEKRIHVVNNGVDPNLFHSFGDRGYMLQNLGFKPDTDLILYLGWFRAIKGPDVLVKSLDTVRRKCPQAKALIISGKVDYVKNGYGRRLMALINKLGLEETVQIRETIPHHNLPEAYNAAKVVVVPSIHESFPKVPLEAMACGIPVVGSNVGGLPEILRRGGGLLMEPQDPISLARQIIYLLSNLDLAKEMGKVGRRRVVENFSWRSSVDQIQNIYEKVLDGESS
jgi:glycosyltransferase involved in cell wall biosynthesis